MLRLNQIALQRGDTFLDLPSEKQTYSLNLSASKSTMFLNQLKDFIAKKIVKKELSNAGLMVSESPVKTIGILFDETYFHEKEALVGELVSSGIPAQNIVILVFKDKVKKNEDAGYPVFSHKDIKWTAKIDNLEVNQFIAKI